MGGGGKGVVGWLSLKDSTFLFSGFNIFIQ